MTGAIDAANGVTILATQTRTGARRQQPVTKHPLFPAVVALWFGALFGLGSLAVRVSLIEQLVLALQLDLVFAAAAPPLGIKARMLIAMFMAVLGVIIGLVLARRLTRPQPVARERKRGAGSIFGQRVAASGRFAGDEAPHHDPEPPARRRGLTIEEEERPEFPDVAPLPGGAPQIFDVTQFDLPGAASDAAGPEVQPDPPLELGTFAPEAEAPAEAKAEAVTEPAVGTATGEEADGRQIFGARFASPEPAVPAPKAALPSLPEAAILPPPSLPEGSAADRIAGADLGALSSLELMERLGLALRNRQPRGAVPAALVQAMAGLGEPQPAQETPAEAMAEPEAPRPEPEAAPVTTPRAFDRLPGAAAPTGASPLSTDDAAPVPMPGLVLPAALRPIDLSQYEEADEAPLEHSLPLRRFAAPAPASAAAPSPEPTPAPLAPAATPEDETEQPLAEADIPEEAYSSLLDIARPAPLRQPFVRIEEPVEDETEIEPVVIFPGQQARSGLRFAQPAPAEAAPPATEPQAAPAPAPGAMRPFDAPAAQTAAAAPPAPAPDPEETERALRSALATLQRMSGAA